MQIGNDRAPAPKQIGARLVPAAEQDAARTQRLRHFPVVDQIADDQNLPGLRPAVLQPIPRPADFAFGTDIIRTQHGFKGVRQAELT